LLDEVTMTLLSPESADRSDAVCVIAIICADTDALLCAASRKQDELWRQARSAFMQELLRAHLSFI
jgi:hypothetical protein